MLYERAAEGRGSSEAGLSEADSRGARGLPSIVGISKDTALGGGPGNLGLEPVLRSEISGRVVACRARAPFRALAAFSFWNVTASADLMKARLTWRQSPAHPPLVSPLA